MAVIQVKTDDWDDLKVKGPEGNVGNIGTISAYGEIISGGWVGFGDEFDYMAFTLDDAAKLSFNISADDAAKFTIYSLNSKTDKKGVTTYSLKSLQSSTLKKQKNGTYLINTKDLLLQQGIYYIGVQSTNAKKGGDADYTVSLNESSKFFTQGDNSDDWTNVKIAGSNACAEICRLGEINRMTNTITIGSGDKANWVGFSDAVDYAEFSLESGAKLSFNISADDAAKFTIYSLNSKTDKKGVTTYSLKSLQSSTLKKQKNGTYLINTKDLLLQQGTYYIGVQSTNAKKGGDADYTVSLNESSKFFTQGNNSDDWTDIKTQGAAGAVGDIGTIYEAGEIISGGWVGFGDEFDYMAFTLDDAAKLSFNISADDAAKFTIYSLKSKTDKKGVTTYSLKSLQSSTLKKQKNGTYLIDTKDLLLQQGTYYIGVQSTNAKKGGDADYTVSLNESSKFFTQGDNSDNSVWDANPLGELYFMDEPMIVGEGYVGLDDTVDFYSFTAEQYGSVMFSISASDAVKFTVYEMVNGKLVTMSSTTVKANSSATSKKITLKADGEYYFSVTSTNAAKGGYADYTVYGCEFAKPLKLTIGGVSKKSFWGSYEDLPAAAQVGDIRGGAGDDTITFAANKCRCCDSIDLGLGNDKLIFKNSSAYAFTEWNSDDATGVINMGDGNNSIEIGKENFLLLS